MVARIGYKRNRFSAAGQIEWEVIRNFSTRLLRLFADCLHVVDRIIENMIAKKILFCAGLVWLIDGLSKWWANTYLSHKGYAVIPNVFYLILGKNPGGSYGLGGEYMEFCLALPATMVFIIYLWLAKREKAGFRPTLLMQFGMACLTGGTLANWSERVIYKHVTDFCFLTASNCIWNLADVFISGGFLLVVIDAYLLARKRRRTSKIDATTGGAS